MEKIQCITQVSQSLSVDGEETESIGQEGGMNPEPIQVAQEISGAADGLASFEQNVEPAAAWNRNAHRFGSAAQFLGGPPSGPSESTAILTDEAVDDLVLVAADDPSVDLAEIDAARERLLNNPNILPFLMERDLDEIAGLLGVSDPLAAVNLAVLREDLEIRQQAVSAANDESLASQH